MISHLFHPLFNILLWDTFDTFGYPENHFTGSLRLNQPIQLYINDNWITDVVIQDNSTLTSYCDLSNNPLLGNPNIAELTGCTKSGLYSAEMLPNTKTDALVKTTTSQSLVGTTINTITINCSRTTTVNNINVTFTEGTETKEIIRTAAVQINRSVISASETYFTTLRTVQFLQNVSEFALNLKMVIRCIINAMILTTTLKKSPYKREIRKMIKKINTKALDTTSALECK